MLMIATTVDLGVYELMGGGWRREEPGSAQLIGSGIFSLHLRVFSRLPSPNIDLKGDPIMHYRFWRVISIPDQSRSKCSLPQGEKEIQILSPFLYLF
jgi:hypothetical protein